MHNPRLISYFGLKPSEEGIFRKQCCYSTTLRRRGQLQPPPGKIPSLELFHGGCKLLSTRKKKWNKKAHLSDQSVNSFLTKASPKTNKQNQVPRATWRLSRQKTCWSLLHTFVSKKTSTDWRFRNVLQTNPSTSDETDNETEDMSIQIHLKHQMPNVSEQSHLVCTNHFKWNQPTSSFGSGAESWLDCKILWATTAATWQKAWLACQRENQKHGKTFFRWWKVTFGEQKLSDSSNSGFAAPKGISFVCLTKHVDFLSAEGDKSICICQATLLSWIFKNAFWTNLNQQDSAQGLHFQMWELHCWEVTRKFAFEAWTLFELWNKN